MFNKKKNERPERPPRSRNISQYGLFDIPSNLSIDDSGGMDDDDDDDLEAELLALTSGNVPSPRKKPKPKPIPTEHLNKIVAESLKDIPSDEDLSGDDDDPELLNELSELTTDDTPAEEIEEEIPPKQEEIGMAQLLHKRLEMYTIAEANAKKSGESTRARRFARGIKTLKDLIKQDSNGKVINPDDIPPEVSTGDNHKTPISEPTPEISESPEKTTSSINEPSSIPTNEPTPLPVNEPPSVPPQVDSNSENVLNVLKQRRDEYKVAAVRVKKTGDVQQAIAFMKIGKQFDMVIKAVEEGQDVDLSNMPGPPVISEPGGSKINAETPEERTTPVVQREENEVQNNEEPTEETLINPENFLDGLIQRLELYKQQEQNAQKEGNSSKARRMGRIIKQYESAIKATKLGKPYPLDELPNPPGFVSIVPTPAEPAKKEPISAPSQPDPVPTSSDPKEQTTSKEKPPVPPRANSVRKMGNQISTTFNERQVMDLLNRQKEFKEAALKAKQKGELAQAKEYLRTAKGFDKVIEAARCGLPVEMESLPIPPSARSQIDESFQIINADECTEDDTGMLDTLFRLENQLTKQLKTCLSTRDHHKALGDIAGMNRFENLALNVTKDLDFVRYAHRNNLAVIPKFHYENMSFNVVKCFTDLNDNDFELTVVRGINYNCSNPKDIDTYVKIEFPYPQEDPFRDRTSVIKDTNNPEYNATFTIQIQRTSRPCLRIFKRQAVKFEVYSKGGFFRGDTLLGTVNVKLQPLETHCEIHDSFDLMDGRKKVGGKLEIRMRVRNPMVTRQIEQLNEKWLVIDH